MLAQGEQRIDRETVERREVLPLRGQVTEGQVAEILDQQKTVLQILRKDLRR